MATTLEWPEGSNCKQPHTPVHAASNASQVIKTHKEKSAKALREIWLNLAKSEFSLLSMYHLVQEALKQRMTGDKNSITSGWWMQKTLKLVTFNWAATIKKC